CTLCQPRKPTHRSEIRDGKRGLLLGDVLTVFSRIPGQHEYLVAPFDCKATVQLQGDNKSLLRLTVSDWPDPGLAPAVRVDFIVEVLAPKVGASAEGIMALLDWCHERIVERCEVVFTEKAKQTFDPIAKRFSPPHQ